MKVLDDYLASHRQQFEGDLCELLRIPSVSADSKYAGDVHKAAQWVLGQFVRMGLKAELIATAGHPIVYAESPAVPGAPVALVYGHYDVQPPDPLNLWTTPPFEPTVRDGNIYARGATDDKGQMLTHVKSAQAWLETAGKLPLQLKFIIEGEEEVGSHNLAPFLEENRDRLACDIVVVSDTCQFGPGQPAITYGLRGIVAFELFLVGPSKDLHSGTFGGAVMNPAIALTKMMSALVDDRGRVQIPGFYDDVRPLTDRERQQFVDLQFDEAGFKKLVGVDVLHGEEGFSTLERRWGRPTFDINGLTSGYQGEGGKTVLPSKASAKFTCRLVPDQDPQQIAAGLDQFFRERLPPGIQMKLVRGGGSPGAMVPLESPFVSAAANAIEAGFGKRPVFIREGGSIPIVNNFKQILGADTLLLGWGLDDDNTHSPNEKFCLADYHRGIKASAYLWKELSEMKS